MRILVLCVFSILFGISLKAQQVSGIAQDAQGKPLAGASVTLKKAGDSSVVKLAVSGAAGKYGFDNINSGRYFVNISHIGYLPVNTPAFEVNGEGAVNVSTTTLAKASAADMKEVVVVSQKPVVEVKADKIVLNVEGSINAVGQDALELLRKSPGVTVDKDNNLSLSGKNGVQVFIDGRPTPLTGADLGEYLKTIQSSSIESIEIISNPSAKYEAAGNAGIINIKLKKNKSFGTNGSVNAGYAVGTYSKYIGGFSLNHRNKNINVFGNYNYSYGPNEGNFHLHRELLDSIFDQHNKFIFTNNSHNFKAGADYTVNKRITIGTIVSGTLADNPTKTNGVTDIYYKSTDNKVRTLVANTDKTGRRDNGNVNLNFRYADTSGREWNMDADYGLFRIKSNQWLPNEYYNPAGGFLYSNTYSMVAPGDIDIYSFKTDYAQNLKKGRLELGAKTSYVRSKNDFQQFNVYNTGKLYDSSKSNNFDYRENINAVYGNYSRNLKGWTVQVGLRVENTNVKGTSTGHQQDGTGYYMPYDSTFNKHYTDFFPSGAVTFNKNPMKQWTLNYSRRIDRPSYLDLNPFEFKLDEYTYQKGNTQLRPQYTNSVGLTFMYKYKLVITGNYSHVNDVFTQLVDTIGKSRSFISKKNLATQDITSLNISYPFQYKWLSIFSNINTYYSIYKANFGTGRTVNVNVFATNFFAQSSARLGKGWTGEISGFWSSPSIWQGTFKTNTIGSLDGGLSKTILKGQGTLKASVSDIFHTLSFTGTSNFAGQYILAAGNFESRQFKLNFTYRFGSAQIKAARQRKTGDEEESKRVGTQGGGLGNN